MKWKTAAVKAPLWIAAGLALGLILSVSAQPSTYPGSSGGRFDRGPKPGTTAPDFELSATDGRVIRASVLWSNKPTLIMTGSYTCPVFREKAQAFQELALDFAEQLNFIIVYTQEAHPRKDPSPYTGGEWTTPVNEREGILFRQPRTAKERMDMARTCIEKLKLYVRVVVDNLENKVWTAYGAAPNTACLVGQDGKVIEDQGWFDAVKMRAAIEKCLTQSAASAAGSLSTKVVDGANRPLSNAVVEVYWLKTFGFNDVRKVSLARLVSNEKGEVNGSYDRSSLPPGTAVRFDVSKEGYSSDSSEAVRPEFRLARPVGAAEVLRVADLKGKAQIEALREVFAGELADSKERPEVLIFVQEDKFRASLREMVTDPQLGMGVGTLLCLIGVPEDVRYVVAHVPAPKQGSFENRWAYYVVACLLEPTTDAEWHFLRDCAAGKYDDLWVDDWAITTLKMIASPKSMKILREVAQANEQRTGYIQQAIAYIESRPPSLSDTNLAAAARKVAQALSIGKYLGNKPPRFNQKQDKALVDCEFISGRDLLVHTATFHKVDGVWKFRGARESSQTLLTLDDPRVVQESQK